MKINEIFHSIQGEGKNVGLPTIFVRTTGCNLRCRYCDTTYAYYEGEEMELQDIMKEIRKWDCKRICLTGGEPLLQEEMTEFADILMNLLGLLRSRGLTGTDRPDRFIGDGQLFVDCIDPFKLSQEILHHCLITLLSDLKRFTDTIDDLKTFLFEKGKLLSHNLLALV